MEKKITIRYEEDGKMTLESTDMPHIEILGLLRYFEKVIWLEMTSNAARNNKPNTIKKDLKDDLLRKTADMILSADKTTDPKEMKELMYKLINYINEL